MGVGALGTAFSLPPQLFLCNGFGASSQAPRAKKQGPEGPPDAIASASLLHQNHRQMWPQALQIRKSQGREMHAPV